MSDDKDAPLDFSALDLMPSWAQESSKATKPDKKFKDHGGESQDRGRGKGFERRGGGQRRDSRGGGSRDSRGGGSRDNRGGYRGKDGGDGRQGYQNQEDFEIKGVKLSFEPTPEAVSSLTKHIQESVKAYPVADLAKMVVNARDRYQIRLKTEKNGPKFYQCKADDSVWLSREEAVRNLVSSPTELERYYRVEEVELDAPKGNFSTIAVCGFSGEVLGPPNHHEYQSTISRVHRQKFSNMSLERYKQRIQMESGEEVLAKWHEKVSKTHHYRLKSDDDPAPVVEEVIEADAAAPVAPATESEASEAIAEVNTEAEVVADEPAAESTDEAAKAAEIDTPAEAPEGSDEIAEPVAEEPVAEIAKVDDGLVLTSLDELERHFRQNFAAKAIAERKQVVFPGDIAGKKLSPDILQLVKSEGRKLRRGFPFEMFQALCNALEKRGLKFFKRGKKALHVSVVRPQAIRPNLSLTDRVLEIIEIVKNSPKIHTAEVLELLCPEFKKPDPDDKEAKIELSDTAKAVLTDIRWLAMEGFLVEFPDTLLEIGRKDPPPERQKKAKSNVKLPPGASTFTLADLKKKSKRRRSKPRGAKSRAPQSTGKPTAATGGGSPKFQFKPSQPTDEGRPEGASTFTVK